MTATYRLQLQPAWGFAAASRQAGYFQRLGISHLYASPVLSARPGSQHGYDVTDPQTVNPELGGADEWQRLTHTLAALGLGLILDIVPNHMAADWANPYWREVLELGPASLSASWFDLEWSGDRSHRFSPLVLPVLGQPLRPALQAGEIQLAAGPEGWEIHYYEHRWPLALAAYAMAWAGPERRAQTRSAPGAFTAESHGSTNTRSQAEGRGFLSGPAPMNENEIPASIRVRKPRLRPGICDIVSPKEKAAVPPPPRPRQVEELLLALRRLGRRDALDEPARWEFAALKQRLAASPDAVLREWSRFALAQWNARPRPPELVRAWLRLLHLQPYQLWHWRAAGQRVNYRRFFGLNHLIGLRQERAEVFQATHAWVLGAVRRKQLWGLRVDHVDGLFDPGEYLDRLAQALRNARGDHAPYIVVEKILARSEDLPAGWPVAGTTGYEFLNDLNDLWLSRPGWERLGAIHARFTRLRQDYATLAAARQRDMIAALFAGEFRRLGRQLRRLPGAESLNPAAVTAVLTDLTVGLPQYRTYYRSGQADEADRRAWQTAWRHAELELARAPAEAQAPRRAVMDFLHPVLFAPSPLPAQRPAREWLRHWQQWTGPVKAKGLEDTAFYHYARLLSQNEVGGDPGLPPISLAAFHDRMRHRLARMPLGLNATATHDTKRGEDARARLNLLTEFAPEWQRHVLRWRRLNRGLRRRTRGVPAPGRGLEYWIYQTLLACWPLDPAEMPGLPARLSAAALKAARESKRLTRWHSPDPDYEAAVESFVAGLLPSSALDTDFLRDFLVFFNLIARPAAAASLAQLTLKCAAPGVPDFYQGCELWDFHLVDPDNRAPVDFDLRARWLEEIRSAAATDLAAALRAWQLDWRSGKLKLYLTWRALETRRAGPQLFQPGEYLPLPVSGELPVCAFARRHGAHWLIAAAPLRLRGYLSDHDELCWNAGVAGGIELPAAAPLRWRNLWTGAEITAAASAASNPVLSLAAVFGALPGAWLMPLD